MLKCKVRCTRFSRARCAHERDRTGGRFKLSSQRDRHGLWCARKSGPQTEIGFGRGQTLFKLRVDPGAVLVHHRPAVFLMRRQTGRIGGLLLFGLGVETVNVRQALDDEAALLGEVV